MAVHAPRWSHLETKRSTIAHTRGEGKMGRYDAINSPAKVASLSF